MSEALREIIDSELLFGLPDRFFLRLRAQEFRRHQTLRPEIRYRKRRHTWDIHFVTN